jgi:hypothetical protein
MSVLADPFAGLVTICILQKLTVATAAKDGSDGDDLTPIGIEISEHFAYSERPICGTQRHGGFHHERDRSKTAKAEKLSVAHCFKQLSRISWEFC